MRARTCCLIYSIAPFLDFVSNWLDLNHKGSSMRNGFVVMRNGFVVMLLCHCYVPLLCVTFFFCGYVAATLLRNGSVVMLLYHCYL